MNETTYPAWHTSAAEQAMCESLDGGCPHDDEFMAGLPWPEATEPEESD